MDAHIDKGAEFGDVCYDAWKNHSHLQVIDRPHPRVVFKDFNSYIDAHVKIRGKYLDRYGWLKSSLINIAHSGIFSSDRTISEYAKDIWNVEPINLLK